MDQPTLRFQRLDDRAVVPAYQSLHAAGLDLHTTIGESTVLEPGETFRQERRLDLQRDEDGWRIPRPDR